MEKMDVTVSPSNIKGTIQAPASKSYTQRWLIGALLAEGTSEILNPGKSADEKNIAKAIESLGAKVTYEEEKWSVAGGFNPIKGIIQIGESGLGVRLISAVSALASESIHIEGSGSLNKRPMAQIKETLQALGAHCETNKGYLPLKVQGPLKGGKAIIDGSSGSQFISGLLFALPLAVNDSEILVKNLKSQPYIDITLDVLNHFGITVENENYQKFRIPGKQKYQSGTFAVEGDWSNGAFLLAAGAINGILKVENLNPQSLQGDRKILEVLKKCGAIIKYQVNGYEIKSTQQLKAFDFDATHTPDLFPPLAALASYCKGVSKIKGVKRLFHKESNRAEALIKEFGKVGVPVFVEDEDYLVIKGKQPTGGTFYSHNDHRIAMAGALMALRGENPVSISHAEAVNKSYPAFFKELEKLRAVVEYPNS
jgi:3-phosphoshikimate 1-carboxyvinyltransferase